MANIKHFGVSIKNKEDGMKLSRENLFKKPVLTENSPYRMMKNYDSWIEKKEKDYLESFDINMKHYETLSRSDFKRNVRLFTEKHNFKQINDLNEVNKVEGLYMMVLDEYCQIYIGISENIKARIMHHWSTQKFEAIVMGDVEKSILPIDCFRALDTTRIFFLDTHDYELEVTLIESFEKKYLTNRYFQNGEIGIDMTKFNERGSFRDTMINTRFHRRDY